MPKAKAKTVRKSAAKRTPKTFKVSFQGVGSLPEDLIIKTGTTFGQFIESKGLDEYKASLNGNSRVNDDTPLTKGDTIRIGLQTKNG